MAFCGVENYAFAQQTLIDVKIDSAAILIGEQTKLHLTLTTDKDKQVQVLIPADTLMRGVEVLERSKPDTTWIENDRMLVKQDVLITSFDSSLYLLPPVLAIDGRDTILSNQVALKVSTVPVNVDAVVYWTVWDVEKAALEVQEYQAAIEHIAQTGLRDTIGKHELATLLQERDKIADDLQQVLDHNTSPWGITCQTVGIKDIAIPPALAEAMSKEAQAERERRARVILGTAETEIAEKFAQASKEYTDNPVALHLRGMNMLFEGLKEKGSMVIVPSSALDTMNLGAMGGLVSLAKNNETSTNNSTNTAS